MKKVVLKVDVHDGKCKQKAMKMVSTVPGVESISIDMEEKMLTLIGDMDAVAIVLRIRKVYQIQLISVGPAKEGGIRKVRLSRKVKELVLSFFSFDVRDGTKEPEKPKEGPKEPETHPYIVYMDRGNRQITTINNDSFLCGSCLCGMALILDCCL